LAFFKFFFDFSPTYVGVGMNDLLIYRKCVSSSWRHISWGVIWPLISTKKGSWYPETPPDSILHGLQGYNVAAKEYEEEEWDAEVGT
jgi:hypothetical protein